MLLNFVYFSDSSHYSPAYTPSPPGSGKRRPSLPRSYNQRDGSGGGRDDKDGGRAGRGYQGRPPIGGGLKANGGVNAAGMSKFCHECGTKYPVMNAKFCCECGVRRMGPNNGDGMW